LFLSFIIQINQYTQRANFGCIHLSNDPFELSDSFQQSRALILSIYSLTRVVNFIDAQPSLKEAGETLSFAIAKGTHQSELCAPCTSRAFSIALLYSLNDFKFTIFLCTYHALGRMTVKTRLCRPVTAAVDSDQYVDQCVLQR